MNWSYFPVTEHSAHYTSDIIGGFTITIYENKGEYTVKFEQHHLRTVYTSLDDAKIAGIKMAKSILARAYNSLV